MNLCAASVHTSRLVNRLLMPSSGKQTSCTSAEQEPSQNLQLTTPTTSCMLSWSMTSRAPLYLPQIVICVPNMKHISQIAVRTIHKVLTVWRSHSASFVSLEFPRLVYGREIERIMFHDSGPREPSTRRWQRSKDGPIQCMCVMVCRQGEWTRSSLASKQPTVILLGDFNFRLQGIPDAEVRAAVHSGSRGLDKLLARDELAPAIDPASAAEGKAGVFTGWKEGFISFPPTFKYSKGTDRYVGDPLPEGTSAHCELHHACECQ